METNLTMKDAVNKVEVAPADLDKRVTRRIEIGSAAQQGDVYLHRLSDNWKRGKSLGRAKRGGVQIAVGQNIGARHMAKGTLEVFEGVALPPGVQAPSDVDPREMLGPVIVADSPWSLTHPEHAHHQLPAGVYGVTYQVDMRTMRRVVD